MSLYKRRKTWHTDFSVNGQRFRQSLDTSDWREAQAKEKELIAQASAGKLAGPNQPFSKLSFTEAAERYLADRIPQLTPNSIKTERERWTPLRHFFGTAAVHRIGVDNVLAYIRQRKDRGIANATINRELDILRGVLKRAKRWHLVSDQIKPLPIRQNVGRALTDGEKVKLLRLAASRPEWQTSYLAATLALNTTMRGCELKGLRWRDVNLLERTLTVRRSKTDAGERVIPLNDEALKAIISLHGRAEALGGTAPDHYVFPACESGHLDPTRAQKTWRTAWRQLTKMAGLRGLRFHDLRHHAITELAESQASDATIMAIAGHVSPKMFSHYSHVRLDAKRRALDALSPKRPNTTAAAALDRGYVTNNVTNGPGSEKQDSEMLENMVELVGIEPTASSLRTTRSPS